MLGEFEKVMKRQGFALCGMLLRNGSFLCYIIFQ